MRCVTGLTETNCGNDVFSVANTALTGIAVVLAIIIVILVILVILLLRQLGTRFIICILLGRVAALYSYRPFPQTVCSSVCPCVRVCV